MNTGILKHTAYRIDYLVVLILLFLVSGWVVSCSSDSPTGSKLGGELKFEPRKVDFSRSQEDDTVDVVVKNNSGNDITIYEAKVNKSYLSVKANFPIIIPDLKTDTLKVNFVYDEFDGVRQTEMVVTYSDTADSPVELQVMLPIKREVTQQTSSEFDEWGVDYHSSHGKILVKRKNERSYTIGMLELNSANVVSVLDSPTELTPVAYSHDGNEILYYKDYSDSASQIFTISIDGGNPMALTDSSARDIPVGYSPDGDRIILHSDRSGNREIYLMNSDGSDVQRYTDNPAKDTPVGITSNNRFLVFNSERNSRNKSLNIFRMNADDGTGLLQLTENDAEDEAVDISPDGDRIAFFSQREGNREIYTMDISGNQVKRLTYNYLLDYPIAYHPDGETILYFSRHQTNVDTYTISEASMIETRITDDYGKDDPVMFFEDGDLILLNTDRNGNSDIYTSDSFVY